MRRRLGLSLLAIVPALGISAQSLVPADLTLDTEFVLGAAGAVAAEFLPDGRMVIISQDGRIRVRPAGGGALISAGSIPVNVSGERGLLGLAVDPDFSTSNRLYFYWSAAGSPANDRHRVGYALIDRNTSIIDTANITTLVRDLFGPANHNGGGITFGPDRNLYIGVGDTGCNCGCSPGNADNFFPTCLTNGNGKILRVDRDGNIPATNPLVGVAAVPACGADPRPEGSTTNGCNAPLYLSATGAPRTDIYNWGFRNPWRFAFDPMTGFLWIGDVGEVTWEEVTISTGPGQHHGWPFREGAHGDPVDTCRSATPQTTGDCVDPAIEYNHNGGSGSVTGGVFTAHCSWPATYRGRYWFSDYTSGFRRVWSIQPNAARNGVDTTSQIDVITNAEGVVHFTTGPDGALYLVNANDGAVWRLAPLTPVACTPDAGVAADATVVADSGVNADASPINADATGTDAQPVASDAAPGSDDALPAGADARPAADALPAGADALPAGADALPAGQDAGPIARTDAAAATPDAGSRDAVTGSPEPASTGCGCRTTSDPGSWMGALVLLGLVSMARRRR